MSNRTRVLVGLTVCGLALGNACSPEPGGGGGQSGAGGEGTQAGASGTAGAEPSAGEAGFGAIGGSAGSEAGGAGGAGGGGAGGDGAAGNDAGGGGQAGDGAGGTGEEECPVNSKLDNPRVEWLGSCTPIDISDDGTVALAREGIWRAESGWIPLPAMASDSPSAPIVLSGDGEAVFGCSASTTETELYRWTAEDGIAGLDAACPAESGEYADRLGTNTDGTILVACGVEEGNTVLRRWTPTDGFQLVTGANPDEVCQHHSASLSSNGATLVADSSGAEGILYIESSTTVSVLRTLLTTQAMVSAVSGDGRVVADYYKPASFDFGASIEADRCLFDECPSPSLTVITSLNHDGSTGIGAQEPPCCGPGQPLAEVAQFHWTSSAGMRHLSDAFFDHGVLLDVRPGAQSILSDDGSAVFGVATRHREDGSSSEECFLAKFAPPSQGEASPLPAAGDTLLASGRNQTCWIQAGRVACWGEEPSTPGVGSRAWSPTLVAGIEDALQVATRGGHACALRAGGKVSCWGDNSFGELGNGTTTSSLAAVTVSGLTSATGIAVGDDHSCALLADGTVQCWGDNGSAQLGGVASDSSTVPVTVPNLGAVTQLVAANSYSCALLSDGTVQCWGEYSAVPTTVAGLDGVVSLSAGSDIFACALRDEGDLVCWEGGDPVGTSAHTPPPADTVAIAAGGWDSKAQDHSICALTSSGTVACAGPNASGQLGSGERSMQQIDFEPVVGLQDVVEISAGAKHACARLDSGQVFCWGDDQAGQLGIGFKHVNRPFGVAKPAPVSFCP